MPKTLTQYVCQACGTSTPKWAGKCNNCGAWNSLVESQVSNSKSQVQAQVLTPGQLSTITSHTKARIKTGSGEVDQVLGGGLVPGSAILISGDPGIGKSTLVLEMAAAVSKDHSVLYISGEESAAQIKLRAERLKLGTAKFDFAAATDADSAAGAITSGKYQLVIVDSIQTLATTDLTGAAGSVGQITASATRLVTSAKAADCALVLIGHVTKEGTVAGPKVLEHLVDVVLYMEGQRYGGFRVLRGIKNRFGSADEAGLFEMTDAGLAGVANPSKALLAERQEGPGSVVFAALEGSRPVLVEVQALVQTTLFGYPKRAAAGFDLNRLNLLVAVLSRRAGLNLNNQDVYVNIAGGLKLSEPAADLAIILAIASAVKNCQIKSSLAVLGEVGLGGEVRSVPGISKRLAEAQKLGFKRAVGPKTKESFGALVGVVNISEAIAQSLAV